MSSGSLQKHVLIVEDDQQVQAALYEVFVSNGYTCELASNGLEGLHIFESSRPPLTITDIKMPVMDGLQFLKQVTAREGDAAVIVLTGVGDVRTAVESLKHGAYDFILKPVNMEQILLAAERALERRQLLIERRQYEALLERRVAEATRDLAQALKELETTYQATLEALGSAIETRDVATELHSRRVHDYSLAIARAHGMPDDELRALGNGVLLHDIGKIGIPDAILLKPGPLTAEEWRTMRTHPDLGRRILERIPFLRAAIPIVYHHHERWDGTGYPDGLKGQEIPLGARIFALADAFDALTFDRPYSRAILFEEARARIQEAAGTHFDPAVVKTFLAMPLTLFEEIRDHSRQWSAR
ncbi:MAG TPA: HD domain-containing phosphohydrolase [Methylomirabilota bacterium]|nr:HD domain-containing phosphohydrolase [Methylomirabilota bacterium]